MTDYVPGLWRCPKCDFRLVQSNLYTANGTVGPRDDPGDRCPNCNGPLWRVSAMEDRNEAYATANKMFDENEKIKTELSTLRALVQSMVDAYGPWHPRSCQCVRCATWQKLLALAAAHGFTPKGGEG